MAKSTFQQKKNWREKNKSHISNYRKKISHLPQTRFTAYKCSARNRGYQIEKCGLIANKLGESYQVEYYKKANKTKKFNE